MAIDTKSVSQLIAEFRKLHAKDTITPESLGYILQRLADLLINSNFRFREVFPGRGRGNDRSEEQRNLGYFYCVPGGDSLSTLGYKKHFSVRMESPFVSNAVISDVRPANLGYYGVADNFGYAGYSTYIDVGLLGEYHGAIIPT